MSGKTTISCSKSLYIEETGSSFLALFPHRFDYLWAEHAQPGETPEWKTETRYPLSDRQIMQGKHLYGVRFGKTTKYALLDIDPDSAYHPLRDPFAIYRIREALEPLGITRCLVLSSSYRGGIHIYLPFSQAQKSGSLALAIEALLEHKGFKVASGQLEIFPDPKPYAPKRKPQLYHGHRLPLQSGSYLLTEDWEPMYSPEWEFVKRWELCQTQNEVTKESLRRVLKTYRRSRRRISTKANQFLDDLQTEIEEGWSSHGQTNRILGRIAMREYIFGHILEGGAPLEGTDLVDRIVKVAVSLPGYTDWCRHQHEIYQRAKEWARAIEGSRYFHYGAKSSTLSTLGSQTEEEEGISWNEQQSQAARDRIRSAIAQMISEGTLPAKTTERFTALTRHKISGTTLYRHRDLWHPAHMGTDLIDPVENPPDPPPLESVCGQCKEDWPQIATSFLDQNECNSLPGVVSGDPSNSDQEAECNVQDEQFSLFQQMKETALQEALKNHKRIRMEGQKQRHIEQMQRYLDSGDPILMAEAIAWAKLNPGVLKNL